MTPPILVTASVYPKGRAVFQAATDIDFQEGPDEEDLLAAEVRQGGARAVVVGSRPYQGPLYEALAASAAGQPALLARFGVGHDNIDKPLARRHGAFVTNTPGTLDVSVAEHTLWLLGNLAKRINRQEARFRQGDWTPASGTELHGKTLVVVGFGAIGRRVAAAAHFGFGMRVVAVGSRPAADFQRRERCPLDELLAATGAATYIDDLAAALGEADAVTLHAPATVATRHLVNAERLRCFPPKALLINTARGALVNEAALYDALAAGRLGGAALDVFEFEPYQPVDAGKDLRNLDNVLLTPHIGSNTVEANRRMAESVVGTVRHFLGGEFEALPRVEA